MVGAPLENARENEIVTDAVRIVMKKKKKKYMK
jgi:hypothetical protein